MSFRPQEYIERLWRSALAPEPALTVSEWADANRILSQKAASEPGLWRTSRTPYLRDIMDELSSSRSAQRIVFMKGAQIGGTEAGNNWLGYIVAHAPGPTLSVQPTVEAARRNSKQRIGPLIEESPALRKIVRPARERDSGNSTFSKEFPGGVLVMTGANSAVGLRSMPVRYLFLDEIDAYPGDADGEGDPVSLAEARTRTFQRRKIFMVSTPTIAGASRVEREYERSDQRRYFVPCPQCGFDQWLKFPQLRWPKGEPKLAAYHCEGCDAPIPERHKTEMLERGEWRATADGDGTVGFHLSSLYSPVGWMSWVEIAQRWDAAQGDPELLRSFVNTVLGETWSMRGDAPDWQDVYDRRSRDYASSQLPTGALILFAGVDVQKDRLEIGIWGFGRDRQRYLVDHRVLIGATNRPDVWSQLAELLDERYERRDGASLPIRDWGIDSGAFSSEVAAFVRAHRSRGNVHAIDGFDRYGGAFLGTGNMDATVNGQKVRRALKTVRIGVSFCKQEFVGQIALERGDPMPPGFVHLPEDVSQEVVKQLTSESLVTRSDRGRTKREWVVIEGRRNEALDCANYARGLAAMRGWDRWRSEKFDDLQIRLDSTARDYPIRPAPSLGTPPPAAPTPPERRGDPIQRRRESWIGRQGGPWIGR